MPSSRTALAVGSGLLIALAAVPAIAAPTPTPAATSSAQPTVRATGTPIPTTEATPDAKATPAVGATATPTPPQVTSLPCAPIAGRYTIGARWGAVGAWSRFHTGQDFSAPVGTPVLAAADGVVLPSTAGGWAGTHVVIRHADGSATLSTFLSTASVRPGDTVTAGQQIGAVGMTGRTFGPHLHFERYPGGVVGDPYTTSDPYTWLLTRPCERRTAATPAPATKTAERSGGLAKTGTRGY